MESTLAYSIGHQLLMEILITRYIIRINMRHTTHITHACLHWWSNTLTTQDCPQSTDSKYTKRHTHDKTLNAGHGSHHEWHWILLTTLFAHHWIAPLSQSTVDGKDFIPAFTPYIIAWYPYYKHHTSLLHIPQRLYHSHNCMPLWIHHHSQLNILLKTQETHCTA